MTEIADFSSTFRRIVRDSNSIAQVERRLHRELTAGQVRVLDELFQAREEQVRRVQRIASIRARIERDRLGRRHVRSVSSGRFLSNAYLARLRRKR